jgi:hypothetical protein
MKFDMVDGKLNIRFQAQYGHTLFLMAILQDLVEVEEEAKEDHFDCIDKPP